MTFHLHHGDCLPWLATLADKSADVVITDPPYSEHVHANVRNTRIGGGAVKVDLPFAAINRDRMDALLSQVKRISKRWIVLFSDFESASDWRESIVATDLDFVRFCVWSKPNGMPQLSGDRPGSWAEAIAVAHPKGRKRWNGGGRGNVWTHGAAHGVDRCHPTQKPLGLMLDLVADFSDADETILDPFAGSGTTGVAALRLGRNFIGAEMDATYHAVATERLTAEAAGTTLQASRMKQSTLFGGAK